MSCRTYKKGGLSAYF